MKTKEELLEYFKGDLFAMNMGAMIDSVSETGAVCSLSLNDGHRNARGAVMGGAIFTLADFAFAVAANAHGTTTVTFTSQIHFLAPAKGSTLRAEAFLVRDGKSACHYRVSVTDEDGREVAELLTSGMKLSDPFYSCPYYKTG